MTDELTGMRERLRGISDPVGLLEALFAYAPIAFQIWSADGFSVLANPAFRSLFGSFPPPGYNVLKDEIAERNGVMGNIRRAFAGENAHVGPIWYDARELLHVSPQEGRRVAIEFSLFPLLDADGAVTHVAAVFKDVTAELSLRASEESLASTLRSIGDGVIATDLQGRVVRMNPVAEKLTGVSLESASGRPLDEVFHIVNEDTRHVVTNPVAEVLKTGTIVGLANHTLLIAADGSERPIADSGAPIRDAEERMQGVVLVFRDQSEERAARMAEERLRLMVSAAPVAFFSLDRDGIYTGADGMRLRSLGLGPGDLIGRSVFEVNADAETHAAMRRGLSGEQLTFRGESRFDGGTFECHVIPSIGPEGELRGLTGVSYDVTEQDKAEQSLRKSEERLRLALAAGRLVSVEIDFETGRCTLSANSQEILGATPEQSSTLSAAMSMIHPDDLPKAQGSLAHALEHGLGVPDVQYRLIRPDNGEIVWFERRVTFVRDASGKVIGLRGLVIDITDRKRAEEIDARSMDLMQQNERMQQANRMKSEFLANMSHELRTPLNAIIGFTELLHDGQVDPASPRYREFLGDILAGGRHLLRLINDVLDLAKVEAGKQEFRPEPVELPKLVREVCAVLRATAANKRIRVEQELDDSLTDIVLDPARFKQVLFNYLSNAIKFTPDGGRVVVRTSSQDEHTFRLEVEDNGIGIATADLGRLFVEFQQLEAGASKKHQGTGLGLVLTRRLVEAQGGSVGVRSKLGEGSTFAATLPRTADALATQRPARPIKPQYPSDALVVLVVEDEARDRDFLVETLEGAGYAVEVCENGSEAMELCQVRRFHAVTLDLLLPDMSGLDLLAGIRAIGRNRDVPVIVVTVVADHNVISSFVVHDVLHKPLDPPQLLSSLNRAGVDAERTRRVLVVDDDPGSLRLMEVTLETLGFSPICRSSGLLGLQAAIDLAPSAVVLDLQMPEMDGFEFLERLRRLPAHERTPVIVWTMKDLSAAERAKLRASVRSVISKDGSSGRGLPAELSAILKRAVDTDTP